MKSVIQINSLTKDYGNKRAVDDITLSISEGQIYGFLGPNGAGKTTTIRCIMDFIRPTSGNIKIFGESLAESNAQLKKRIGYLSADSALYANWTAKEHIGFVAKTRQVSSKKANELVTRLSLDLNTKARKLSSGNRQKLSIVLAMMHEPELLILDEPTRGLDPLLQEIMHEYLVKFKNQGGSVFVSSHDFGEVERICDQIGIIRKGNLVASETLQSILKMQIHNIKILFSQKLDLDLFKNPNTEIISSSGKKLTVNVSGNLNDFLKLISQYKIHDIEINHLSLEDAFLRYYDD